MSMEPAKKRLERLLTMVPWVLKHPGEPIEVVAETFGVSAQQVEKDLSVIFLCGTPGITPDVLIEAEWESGEVFIRNADEISRPLRLGPDEALSLIVALKAMAAVPGLADPEVVESALAKLTEVTGYTGDESTEALSARIGVHLADEGAAQWLAMLRAAVRGHERVRLTYLNPARDEVTERDVDPMRLERSGAHWYLRGWCHRAEDVRTFRVDRIQEAGRTGETFVPGERWREQMDDGPAFTPSAGAMEVTLQIAPSASWICEYYPVLKVTDVPGAGGENTPDKRVTLQVGDPSWVRRLAWQLGGSVCVLAPSHLASEVARGAERALDYYAERGT